MTISYHIVLRLVRGQLP